ncbi:MAG: hypothetical protein ACRDQD_01160 [Nocardioidaceae bacterium]
MTEDTALNALIIVFGVLTTARLTRLFTADRIMQWIRDKAEAAPRAGYLVTCDWCLSMWLAFPVAVSAWYWGSEPTWLVCAGALSASYVTGYLAALEPDKG